MKELKPWMIVAGFFLAPIFFALFIIDRFVFLILPHVNSPKIQNWWNDPKAIVHSLIRVVTVGVIFGIFTLISRWN
jgi:hypothetical protein